VAPDPRGGTGRGGVVGREGALDALDGGALEKEDLPVVTEKTGDDRSVVHVSDTQAVVLNVGVMLSWIGARDDRSEKTSKKYFNPVIFCISTRWTKIL